jgi:hypothetical protein
MPFAKPKVKPKGSRTFTQTGYADRLHVYTNLVSGGVVEVFHGTRETQGVGPAHLHKPAMRLAYMFTRTGFLEVSPKSFGVLLRGLRGIDPALAGKL